jgi:acetylornithine deacetylase/succinyl-diaminopimelate desuccinylase-like protein
MNPPGLDNLLTCLRFPSVSTDSSRRADVRACAEWLLGKVLDMGLTGALHETPGHPVLLAKNQHIAGRRTVLLYAHYDVQPAEPLGEWQSPAFEPTIRDGRIFCRGATDNKGQLMAHMQGLAETLEKHADLPVNLTLLFEGEEEIGSPNLKPFLEQHREVLKCDVVAISDTGMVAPGVGTFTYGLRGIACMEAKIYGPTIDLHSGIFGGAIANPVTAIARLTATLHDAAGRVMIDGFYDGVRPIADTERERRWARPTAEVNGIGGGYQGEGSKTVIGREAFVKISFRLVPDQHPDLVLQRAAAHLQAHLPAGVRLEIKPGHTGMPYLMDPHSPLGTAAQRALKQVFGDKIALIREGGSIPIVQAFKDVLHAETLLLGLALPDCQAHAPNENFPIENFVAGVRLNQALLAELA